MQAGHTEGSRHRHSRAGLLARASRGYGSLGRPVFDAYASWLEASPSSKPRLKAGTIILAQTEQSIVCTRKTTGVLFLTEWQFRRKDIRWCSEPCKRSGLSSGQPRHTKLHMIHLQCVCTEKNGLFLSLPLKRMHTRIYTSWWVRVVTRFLEEVGEITVILLSWDITIWFSEHSHSMGIASNWKTLNICIFN